MSHGAFQIYGSSAVSGALARPHSLHEQVLRALRRRLDGAPGVGSEGGEPWRAHVLSAARAGTQARDSAVLAEYAALVEDTHALKELLRSYNIGRGEEVSRPGHLEDVARHVGLQMPKKAD